MLDTNTKAQLKSYLERATLKAICGVAEQGQDNDGAGGAPRSMAEGVKADYLAAIDALADKLGAEKLWKQIADTCSKLGDVAAYDELKGKVAKKVRGLSA